MAEPDSQATSFSIRLLEGSMPFIQQGMFNDEDRIELIGRMLPHKGVSFPTEQRTKTTYYPGNPVGTQQVFGATKKPTTITGVWDDGVLGTGVSRALVRQFEYVVEHGLPVEVRWGAGSQGTYNDIGVVRRGLIKSIDPKYDMPQIVNWTIEFEWRGEDLQTAVPTFAAGPSAISTKADEFGFLADSATKTDADVASWKDSVFSVIDAGVGALATINDALDTAQSSFANALIVLNYATDLIQSGAELPSNVADRVRGACDQVVASCMGARGAYDACCGLYPLAQGLTGDDWIAAAEFFQAEAKRARLALVPNDDPLDQLSYCSQTYEVIDSLDIFSTQAAEQAAALSAQLQPLIIAELWPPAGTDLRDLAVKYYQDAELWVLIADFNDLDTSEVPAVAMGPSDLGAPPILIPDQDAYAAMLATLWGAPQQDNSQGSTA